MNKNAEAFANAPKRLDIIILFVSTTTIGVVGTALYEWFYDFNPAYWLILIGLVTANNLSITAGYHRLWSHKTYKANIFIRALLALIGAMALQNSILKWAADHRRHHRFIDDNDKDPYSAKRGFWFSHIGWMLRDYPSSHKDLSNVRDLKKDPVAHFQHRYYLPLAIGTNLLVPTVIGFIEGHYIQAFLIAGFLRLVIGHHTTFFINSLAHIWGSQPYSKQNTARNNVILSVLTFGEGYHNYHHAFPGDYRNAIEWWQWDPTKWLIKTWSIIGLADQLRRTPKHRIQTMRPLQ